MPRDNLPGAFCLLLSNLLVQAISKEHKLQFHFMKQKPPIEMLILNIRGERVILAADLADIYGVETRVLTQAIKRNAERFPADFSFQLTPDEFSEMKSQGIISHNGRASLRSQFVILKNSSHTSQSMTPKRGQHAKYPPLALTEHGAIMAANVLNSPNAISMSVFVVRAFIQMREHFVANAAIFKRLAEIDKALLQHDQALHGIWQQLKPLLQPPPVPPRRKIGFHGVEKE
jgi:phage regulator Rha-like protein